MADQNRRKPEFPLVLGNHAQDGIFPDRVLAGSGFIEEDDSRIRDQSPCQGCPLLHAAGEFRGIFMGRILKLRLFDSGHNLAIDPGSTQVRRLAKGKGNIFIDGHGIEEGIILKHVADLSEIGGALAFFHLAQGFALEENNPFIRLEQPDDMLEEHTLARTAQADDGSDLPLVDLQVDPFKDASGAEALADILELD